MKFKTAYLIGFCFLGSILAIGCAPAEEVTDAGTGGGRQFPQPAPESEVTVTAIPGVVAAGSEWELVWQGPDNADGLVATEDGGIVFAQEQPSTVGRLDPNDNFSIFVRDTNGTGGVTFDIQGRLIGAERTCSDPGGRPEECHEPARLVVLHPTSEVLASHYDGQTFWRMRGDVAADSRGGVYFADREGTYYVNPTGEVSLVAHMDEVGTNGLILSLDELDPLPDEWATRSWHTMSVQMAPRPIGGSSLRWKTERVETACASTPRIGYTSRRRPPAFRCSAPRVEYLGKIPLPRPASSATFSGPAKNVLYAKGAGMKLPDGSEYRTPEGVRNNAKAIYKIGHDCPGNHGPRPLARL